jgi:hypothetical protein
MEISVIQSHGTLNEYYVYCKKSFNEALATAKIMSGGQFQLNSSESVVLMKGLANILQFAPFAGTILYGVQAPIDVLETGRKIGLYSVIAEIVPDSDPVSASHFSEVLARRLTMSRHDKILEVANDKSSAANKFRRLLLANLEHDTVVGIIGSEMTSVQMLGFADAKLALDIICNKDFNRQLPRSELIAAIIKDAGYKFILVEEQNVHEEIRRHSNKFNRPTTRTSFCFCQSDTGAVSYEDNPEVEEPRASDSAELEEISVKFKSSGDKKNRMKLLKF